MAAAIVRARAATAGPVGTPDVFGSVADFGTALFTAQLLPFEVTAFILMVAVIGVVLLAGDASAARAVAPTRRPRRTRDARSDPARRRAR